MTKRNSCSKIFHVECIEDFHCNEANKGICNSETSTCECDQGYREVGKQCLGEFDKLLYSFKWYEWFRNFLLECIDDMDCKEENKGECDMATNTCKCDDGYQENGYKCIGRFWFATIYLSGIIWLPFTSSKREAGPLLISLDSNFLGFY